MGATTHKVVGQAGGDYGMGRHNHENSVAIPSYGSPVVLSGDDTFTGGPLGTVSGLSYVPPAQSQLYS